MRLTEDLARTFTMTATDMLRAAFDLNEFNLRFVLDMADAPLTFPTPRGGNHPLWVVGHLAHSEASFHQGIVGGDNPLEGWAKLFGPGTEPTADAADYPPFDEVLAAYRTQRARSLALLDELGEAGLDRPIANPPKGVEHLFSSVGKTLMLMATHHSVHIGQVLDARRAAGRKPLNV